MAGCASDLLSSPGELPHQLRTWLATSFQEIVVEAQTRWQELTVGDRPWIRIGSALCGKAAGCDSVTVAIEGALEAQGVRAHVSQVGCIGLCFAEPLVDVQFPGGPRIFYGNVTPEIAKRIVANHVAGGTPDAALALGFLPGGSPSTSPSDSPGASPNDSSEEPLPDEDHNLPAGIPNLDQHPMRALEMRIVLRNSGTIDPLDIYQYVANGGYRALDKALTEMTPEETLDQVANSGLRGRGGAAFSTGTKWKFLAGSGAPVKYILCNCEEGDPGAFNDKAILESDPHTLLEGLILSGYATGASNGYIFIRHGHDGPIDRCRAAVKQARDLGLWGENILDSGFSFEVEVALTGDSYVAGEESGLMEAIEGKRAMPRHRPPFPAQVGLLASPPTSTTLKPWHMSPR